ncbi:hypothetical protein PZ938_02950 [Luteipulveratus sp. YIM 133132]|uniref:hypothetical protein n=1 Tax=Luteipulveratus flavus TaxID=3031728 RepID=UPI0023AF386B|nr:hypothetical protein [Luteipulveratus sp. YIM 133132]MDE9364550.1 hypothetical protein [Luteipulveratus sp. YIM 133132]
MSTSGPVLPASAGLAAQQRLIALEQVREAEGMARALEQMRDRAVTPEQIAQGVVELQARLSVIRRTARSYGAPRVVV